MMRVMLYEAAQIMLLRSAKWSWLKAWIWKLSLDLPIGLSHRPRDRSVVSSLHCMNECWPGSGWVSVRCQFASIAVGGTIMARKAPDIKGVRVFPPPPKGFDALAASKTEAS